MKDRIIVHIGAYGSGKTELSIDEALRLRQEYEPLALVDLDIVNPYFRSGEHVEMLEAHGIHAILPTFANTAVDVPAVSAEVQRVLDDGRWHAVFDVGGDPVGAAALGRYHEKLKCAWVRCIVNTMRPFSQTVEEIVEMARLMESRARTPISSFVHNTHLAGQTTRDMVLEGLDIVERAAREMGLPVEMTMAQAGMEAQLQDVPNLRVIRRYNRLDWQEEA